MRSRCAPRFGQIVLVGFLLLLTQNVFAQGMRVRVGVSGMV